MVCGFLFEEVCGSCLVLRDIRVELLIWLFL